MKSRFTLFRRGQVFYCQDSTTGQQSSLRTKDEAEAQALLHSKNEAFRQPVLNLQIARTYLTASDPETATRPWQTVMDEMGKTKHGPTKIRHDRGMRDKTFDLIRDLPLLENQVQHFLKVLSEGTVSTNMFLVRLQNFALGMNWLAWPILPKKRWPKISFHEKRAITWEEHTITLNISHAVSIASTAAPRRSDMCRRRRAPSWGNAALAGTLLSAERLRESFLHRYAPALRQQPIKT